MISNSSRFIFSRFVDAYRIVDDFYFSLYNNGEARILRYFFRYNSNKYHIIIPAKVSKYRVTDICEKAFSRLPLKSITIPDSVSRIGKRAFEGSIFLHSLVISANNPFFPQWTVFCSAKKSIG